jgi:REP element-mobilizing transposase RayT
MVAGYHLIWTAYGWWLPNDPRGSWSDVIRVEKIEGLGEPHYGRKSRQPLPAEIRRFYEQVRDVLAHPLLPFDDDEIAIIAGALAQVIEERGYTCYACALMSEHVHLLIRRHRDKSEEMIEFFQRASRAALIAANKRSPTHPVWGGPGWKRFLNSREHFEQVVAYPRQSDQDW